MKRLIDFGALFFLMLFTGVFVGTWLPISRYISDLSAAEFLKFMQLIINSTAVPMQIIMPTGVALAAISVWNSKSRTSRRFYIAILSVALFVVVLVISLAMLVPLNLQLIHLAPGTIPDDWEHIRDKWKAIHTLRTFIAIVGYAGFAWYIGGRRVVNQGLSYSNPTSGRL